MDIFDSFDRLPRAQIYLNKKETKQWGDNLAHGNSTLMICFINPQIVFLIPIQEHT